MITVFSCLHAHRADTVTWNLVAFQSFLVQVYLVINIISVWILDRARVLCDMLQELPSSLCLLLETQVEEELYADWASLLETILISYCPPRTHLILCFTLLIHPSVAEDHSLHSSCLKIVVRTLKRYGPRAFRNVLGFNPARQQRRKARESNNETQTDIVGHDSLQIDLVTTESVFSKFSSLWELMSFRFSLEESKARRWQQLIGLLVEILQQDWKLACKSKLDLTKTLVVQQLRDVDENRVDLQKQVFKPLFAGLTNNGENQGTPYEGLDVHFSTDEDPSLPQCLPDQFLHMLFAVSELVRSKSQVFLLSTNLLDASNCSGPSTQHTEPERADFCPQR